MKTLLVGTLILFGGGVLLVAMSYAILLGITCLIKSVIDFLTSPFKR